MTLMGAYGSLCFKKAATQSSVRKIIEGVFWYGSGMIINILALKFYDYTLVFPLTALTYVWSFFFGTKILHEPYNKYNITGLILVCCGAILLSLA